MKIRLGSIAALATMLFVAAACGSSSTDLTQSNSGQVNLLLTDAPFPFAEVKRVDVFVVRIDGKTADTNDTEAANESDLNGWTTLVSPNTSINLLDLTNGKTANLGVATLPAGTYRGFRLIIDTDKSSVTLNDNTKPDVKWPSAGKNGIRLLLDDPFVLGGTGSSSLLIDFDLGRSFVMRGNSISQNGLLFKPVIRATTQQSTGTVTGSVHGDNATGPAIASATIEVLKNGTTLTDTNSENVVRSGVTDGSGNFTLAFIRPGTYVLRATPPAASLYKPAILNGVTITAGTVTGGQLIVVTK
jgi:hypothetical protein